LHKYSGPVAKVIIIRLHQYKYLIETPEKCPPTPSHEEILRRLQILGQDHGIEKKKRRLAEQKYELEVYKLDFAEQKAEVLLTLRLQSNLSLSNARA
jgi:hypothetical protein